MTLIDITTILSDLQPLDDALTAMDSDPDMRDRALIWEANNRKRIGRPCDLMWECERIRAVCESLSRIYESMSATALRHTKWLKLEVEHTRRRLNDLSRDVAGITAAAAATAESTRLVDAATIAPR